MKKATTVLLHLLFGLILLLPAGELVSSCFGCTFRLVSVPSFAIGIALLSACAAIFCVALEDTAKSRPMSIWKTLLFPLSLINAALFLLESRTILTVVSAAVFVGCCCFMTARYGKPLALKITALVLSILMIIPIAAFGFIALIFGDIAQSAVVQTIESPDGKYYAQVIDSDQGALGGDTIVNVHEQGGLNAGIFIIEKKPKRVYLGEWGEFEDMQIHWKEDGCLVINTVEYKIE